MADNLAYTVSLDVRQALRDAGNLAAALETRLAGAARRARDAIAALERTRIPNPAELAGASGTASASRSRLAPPPVVALAAGAIGARLALPAPNAPQPASASLAVRGGMAASAAVVAAREITAEARAAFAPLRLALSRLRLPTHGGGGGNARPALPAGDGVIDVESTVVSQKDKAPNAFAQAWQRAVGSVRSLFTRLRDSAAGIVTKIDVGGALRSVGGLLGRLTAVREEVKKTHDESEKGGGMLAGVGGAAKTALAPLAALAAGYLSLSFATHQFAESISRAADFEQLKVGFTVLLQSGAKAKAMLADLTKFADTTPLEMPELAQAARTLLAFGDPAESVMKDLRQLGDIAAGVQAPIGEIAELFGKARTEGTLFSIDIRELTRRGIPIIGELAKQFHVSESAIHSMTESGRIKFADLQTAIGNLTSRGGMFFGMLAAQGETFNGKISTMRDALGALYREFGTPLLAPLKGGVTEITALLAGWKGKAQEWGQTVANFLSGTLAIINNGDVGKTFGAALKLGIAEAVNLLYRGAVATVGALIAGMGAAANVLIQALGSSAVWKTLADGANMVGGRLAASIMRALADVFTNIPYMSKVALALNVGANRANRDANESQDAAQKDLQNTDVQGVVKAAANAAGMVGDVFSKTFAATRGPMDQSATDAKAALAAVVGRANARNNPLPVYTDTGSGEEYGPGAPYGSPDSQMPPPGTKPVAADLGAGLRALLSGTSGEAPAPDPGEGTINGRPSGVALGNGQGGPIGVATPGPFGFRPPTLPIPNLNARAEAAINGGRGPRDPDAERTARAAAEMAGHLRTLVDLARNPPPPPAAVF